VATERLFVVLEPSPEFPTGLAVSAPVTTYTFTEIRLLLPLPAVLLAETVIEVPVETMAVQIDACPEVAPASPISLSILFVQVSDPPDTETVISVEERLSALIQQTKTELLGGVKEADVMSTPFAGVPVNRIGELASMAIATAYGVISRIETVVRKAAVIL
jgi:hypothetical protein